jgi:hypothetical protein
MGQRVSHLETGDGNVSTALVPVAAAESRDSARATKTRPNADFLAQLIAAAGKAPQARQRRRAEPQDAIAAYVALDRPTALSGRALSRSL